MNATLSLLAIAVNLAHAAVIRTTFGTQAVYVSMDSRGYIRQLDPAGLVPKTANYVIDSNAVASNEVVLERLLHMKVGTESGLIKGVVGPTSARLEWKASSTTRTVSVPGLKDFVSWKNGRIVVLANGVAKVSSVAWSDTATGFTFQPIETNVSGIEVQGGNLWLCGRDGSLRKVDTNNMITSVAAPDLDGDSIAVGPVPFVMGSTQHFAAITDRNRLITWLEGGTVVELGRGRWGDLAVGAQGTATVLRAMGSEGQVVEWSLPSTSPRWLVGSGLARMSFARDGKGARVFEQTGRAPSGWGWIGTTFSRLFGLYHHEGGVAITRFDIDPNPWAPRKIAGVLIRYAAVGDQRCSSMVTLHLDSNGVDTQTVQQKQVLRYGVTDANWDGKVGNLPVPSRAMWARLKVWTSDDSIVLWKSFVVDRSAASGAPVLVGVNSSDTVDFRLSNPPRQVDWSLVKGVPTGDSVLIRETILARGTDSLRYPFKDTGKIQALAARDPLGLPLPDGMYRVFWRASDSAGNDTSWIGPMLRVRAFHPFLEGSVVPLLVTSKLGSRGNLGFAIKNDRKDTVRVTLMLDDSVDVGAILGRRWRDTTIILDSTGRFSWNGSFGPLTLRSGNHWFRLTVRNSEGDSVARSIPFGMEQINTLISYPLEGTLIRGKTEVRGVATAPTLSSGFDGYWLYWTKGLVQPTTTDSTINDLLSRSPWRGVPVPLANQSRAKSSNPQRDLSWPESNHGVNPVTSDGTLGWFSLPASSDTGVYTLLAVSQETVSGKKKISWATRRVRWAGTDSIHGRLTTRDSATNSDTTVLDRRDSTNGLDSAVIKIQCTSPFQGDVLLLEGETGTSKGMISRSRVSLVGGVGSRWVFRGIDPAGATLDSGRYTLVVEGVTAQGLYMRAEHAIVFMPPRRAATIPVLEIEPKPVKVYPSIGLVPAVKITVSNPRKVRYALEIRSVGGDSLVRLATDVSGAKNSYTWNFRQGSIDLLAGEMSTKKFRLVWIPIGDSTGVVESEIIADIDTSIAIDTTSSLLVAPGSDSVWYPETTSKFKFKALARGKLQYFPDRRVFIAPNVSGDQVIRVFKSVPWRLPYRKFYNSVDIIAEGSYNRSGFTDGDLVCDDKKWEAAVSVRGDAFNSYYNFEDGRGINIVAPSSTVNWSDSSIYFGDSAMLTLPVLCPESDWKKFYDNALHPGEYFGVNQTCNGNAPYVYAGQISLADAEFQKIAKQKCPPFRPLNKSGVEPPEDDVAEVCRVFALSGTGDIADKCADDVWTSVGGRYDYRWIQARLRVPNTVEQGLSSGHLVFSVLINTTDNVRLIDTINPAVDMSAISGYWTKRTSRYGGFATNYALYNDKWDNDFETQANYLQPLNMRWEHPYFFLKAYRSDSLNFARMKSGRMIWDDVVPWNQSSGTINNGGELTDTAWNIDPVTKHAVTGFAGPKIGIRGFAYRGDTTTFLSKFGVRWRQDQYIRNFWNRTRDSGMAYWKMDQHQPGNQDDIEFRPILRIDDSVFGVTWDSLTIAYPYGDLETNAGVYWDKGEGDSIIAFRRLQNVDWYDYPDLADTAKSVVLHVKGLVDSNDLYVATDTMDLRPYFDTVLARTDSTRQIDGARLPKYYGYIRRKSLLFRVPMRSIALGEGQDGAEIDTSGLFLSDSILSPNDSTVKVLIRYRNKPTTLGNWSSALDTTFRRTKGWIYGSQEFNKDAFKGRDIAIPGGFLKMIDASKMPDQSPSSMSPFVRRYDPTTTTYEAMFNKNVSLASMNWDLEVFYADGSSPNTDLDTSLTSPYNFSLQLLPDRSNKVWAGLRGKISDSAAHNGAKLPFRSYSVYVRKADDTSGFLPLSVNRFFVTESGSALRGDIKPDTGIDLWDTTKSASVLAWWDVSNKVGAHEVLVTARYASGMDSVLVTQRRRLVLGTTVKDSGEIVSPYQRAMLRMPQGSTGPGTNIALTTVSKADVMAQGVMPEVQPLGPILKVTTTGNTEFGSDTTVRPRLTVRLLAREVYESEGKAFTSATNADSAENFLRKVQGNYLIHLLNSAGKLDAVPTVAAVKESDDVESVVLELVAQPTHFSLAMVLRKDKHDGRMPVIDSLRTESDSLRVWGLYDGIRVPWDSIRFDTIPEDLEMLVRSSRTDDTTVYMQPVRVSVNSRGLFRGAIPVNGLPEGQYALVIRYVGSTRGVRALFWREGDTLRVSDWSFVPDSVVTSCGSPRWSVQFTANRRATGQVLFIDPTGQPQRAQDLSVTVGRNSLSWDGCIDGMAAKSGAWKVVFQFGSNPANDRSIRIGVGAPAAGLKSLQVSPSPWQPSRTDRGHVLTSRATVKGYDTASLQLRVRKVKTGQSVVLPLTRLDSTRLIAKWDGRFGTVLADTGIYQAVLVHYPDTSERLETEFRIGREIDPGVSIRALPDTVMWPAEGLKVQVTSTKTVWATVWLETVRGDSMSLTPTGERVVNSQPLLLGWSWTRANAAAPKFAVVHWRDALGNTGYDTALIHAGYARPKIDSSFMSPRDSIFPDFKGLKTDSIKAKGFPSALEFGFVTDRGFSGFIDVVDSSGRLVRKEPVKNIKKGYYRTSWGGVDSLDSLVREGRYSIRLWFQPEHADDAPSILSYANIHVARQPQIVLTISSSSDPNFVRIVRDLLLSKRIRTWVLGPEATVRTLEAYRNQTIAFMDATPDTALFAGSAWNRVFRLIRAGGRAAFFGHQPLSHVRRASGSDSVSLGPTLALLGIANPYATPPVLNWHARSQFQKKPVSWLDSTRVNQINPFFNRLDRYDAVNFDTLMSQEDVWVRITGFDSTKVDSVKGKKPDSSRIRYAHGYYGRPHLFQQDPNTHGEVLMVHPFGGGATGAMASEYGSEIYRFFFTQDLSIGPHQVGLKKDSVGKRVYKRGQRIDVGFRFDFLGDSTLDSVVLRAKDSKNPGFDTTIVFYNVTAKSLKQKTISLRVDTGAPYGRHTYTVSIDPYVMNMAKADGTSGFDTIHEPNILNNTVEVEYMVKDTVPPLIDMNNVDTTQAHKGFLGFITNNPEARPRLFDGKVKTRHGLEQVAVSAWLLAGNDTLAVGEQKVAAKDGEWKWTVKSMDSAMSKPDSIRLKLRMTDMFGVSGDTVFTLKFDKTPPRITRFRLDSAPFSGDSISGKCLLPKINKQYRLVMETMDESWLGAYRVLVVDSAKDKGTTDTIEIDSTYWRGTMDFTITEKQLGTWSMTVWDEAGNPAVYVLELMADTEAPKVIFWRVTGKSFLDTLRVDTTFSSSAVRKQSLCWHVTTDTVDTSGNFIRYSRILYADSLAFAPYDSGWSETVYKHSLAELGASFVLTAADQGKVKLSAWWDGDSLTEEQLLAFNPYLPNPQRTSDSVLGYTPYHADVAANARDHYLRLPFPNPVHELAVIACDPGDRCTKRRIYFESPLADLQVIDSADIDDPRSGPDYGDVYMRKDRFRSAPDQPLQNWVYWLVHDRDADSLTGPDYKDLPWILVDSDNDSTTGSVIRDKPGISGFDRAISIVYADSADSASGFKAKLWRWEDGRWIEDEHRVDELSNDTMLRVGANQPDNPLTRNAGEGAQWLPTNTLAKTANGAWEIGLRIADSTRRGQVRWAMLPSQAGGSGMVGDTVMTPEGNARRFKPLRDKPVTVDGFSADWLQNPFVVLIPSTTRDSTADSVRVRLSLVDSGTAPATDFRVLYFYNSPDSGEVRWRQGRAADWVAASIDSVPSVHKARDLPELAHRLISDSLWVATVRCSTCVLGLGKSMELGDLVFKGTPASDTFPDWSRDTGVTHEPNYRVVVQIRTKTGWMDVWGNWPTDRVLKPLQLSVSVLQGDQLDATEQKKLKLRATVTDPEGRTSIVTWRAPGHFHQGVDDSFWLAQTGRALLVVRAQDSAKPGRFAETTLVVWNGGRNNGAGNGTEALNCGCSNDLRALLREVAPYAVLPALSGLPAPDLAPSLARPRVSDFPWVDPKGTIANQPLLPWIPRLQMPLPGPGCVQQRSPDVPPWERDWEIVAPSWISPLDLCEDSDR